MDVCARRIMDLVWSFYKKAMVSLLFTSSSLPDSSHFETKLHVKRMWYHGTVIASFCCKNPFTAFYDISAEEDSLKLLLCRHEQE